MRYNISGDLVFPDFPDFFNVQSTLEKNLSGKKVIHIISCLFIKKNKELHKKNCLFFPITFTLKQGALETRDKHFSNKTLIMMSVL